MHHAYLVGIALKGLDGLTEVAGGAVLLLISRATIVCITAFLVDGLSDEPRGFIASHALHAAKSLSPGTQHFASIYLPIHGLIKMGLVAGLLRGWRHAYPVALLLLAAFIGYQCYRLFRHHSLALALFTAIDIAIVVLIWLEWRCVKPATTAAH